MTAASGPPARFRAPEVSGGILAVPPRQSLAELALRNREQRDAAPLRFGDRSLAEAARQAREEFLLQAWRATRRYADPPPPDRSAPLVVTGHQPGFVHPGVWLKNFIAAETARQLAGNAVNLVIDGDLARGSTVRVLAGDLRAPRLEHVAFDAPQEPLPWEERGVVDRDLWESFGRRAGAAVNFFSPRPTLAAWWPLVLARSGAGALAGAALAQGRHLLESSWQANSLELAQSELCQLREFRRFACQVIDDAVGFRTAYNGALAAFRRGRRIRNRAHPAPDLGVDDRQSEAPLWIWSNSAPHRRGLWVRRVAEGMELTDRGSLRRVLPWKSATWDDAIDAWAAWEAEGVRIRSRALMTTLFARLFLGDLFIHGIGGAHYDQVTDDLCQRLWGAPPPPFATVSGTLRLAESEATAAEPRHWRQLLRDVRYHPEAVGDFVGLPPADRELARQLAEQKRQALGARGDRCERHRAIESANRQLHALLHRQTQAAEQRLASSLDRMRQAAMLASREYAFCLFDAESLKRFLLPTVGERHVAKGRSMQSRRP